MTSLPTPVRVGHVDAANTLEVPWVILAAILIAIGILAMIAFLFSFQFPYLGGALLVLAGSMMLMSPRAGSDHA